MADSQLASTILEKVGGQDNVSSLGHCATRLRFVLKDESLADTAALKTTKGVIDVVAKGGQYQVVIGPGVADVYQDINNQSSFAAAPVDGAGAQDDKNLLARALDMIAGSFFPIIPAIVGGGMLKAIAAILLAAHLLDAESMSYQFLTFMGDAAFYFLPLLIGVSAAHKFQVNPYVSAALGAMLVHPTFVSLAGAAQEGGPALSLFGLPVQAGTYSSSVIPIFLMVWLQSYVEPLAKRIMPSAVHMVSTPLLTSLVVGVVGFVVLAPLGNWAGQGLAAGVNAISGVAPWLVPTLMGTFTPLLVMVGMHYAIIPIGINLLATTHRDPFVGPGMLVSNVAQGGAALGVALRAKDVNTRSVAASTGFTAVLGITEPALYGINLRFKRPLIAAMIGGGLGGLVVGVMGVARFAQVAPGLLALPSYINPEEPGNLSVLIWAIVAVVVAFISAFLISLAWGIDERADAANIKGAATAQAASGAAADDLGNQKDVTIVDEEIHAPLNGEAIALAEVSDPVFSGGALGQGIAIVPASGRLVAPADGTITVMFPTGHAVGMTTTAGAELLMHIGFDTVSLDGEHFTTHVQQGAEVKRGDLLVEFDVEAIRAAGYEVTTPVVVTNTAQYSSVRPVAPGPVAAGDDVLVLTT
ncbi:beta-glucoside-specific PTS transporter subunit IIABC [Actinomyces qiguomingii]|uniref:beta-glucoside-specific PTS transporter subunit IIABC n=1 Tax=Actinomyces qiguomingii TaxID=2057800 RepID=UPI000CA01E45|nr:beta-glucoside-specific PTS transporter subunit IIABC [Actinomyces qiguomingii]